MGDNQEWYLKINPKWHFTKDGNRLCDVKFIGPYTTKIKSDEHNLNVLNHTLFWAYFLARGKSFISISHFKKKVMGIENQPLTGIADFAIPNDPAITTDDEAEKVIDQKPLLFDFENMILEEGEDIDETDFNRIS